MILPGRWSGNVHRSTRTQCGSSRYSTSIQIFEYDVMLDRYEEVYHHVVGDPLKAMPSTLKKGKSAGRRKSISKERPGNV